MKARNILIFGCGYQGKIVFEILKSMGVEPKLFVDDGKAGQEFRGIPVVSREQSLKAKIGWAAIAIGNDNEQKINLRKELIKYYSQKGVMCPSVVDPTSVISVSAEIGVGVIIHPNVTVMADTQIDAFCILSTSCSIDHDNHIEEFVNVCPGVVTAGNVIIKTGAFIGTGAIVLPGITIGANAVVGAGAVVIKDVAANTTVVGNPARVLKK